MAAGRLVLLALAPALAAHVRSPATHASQRGRSALTLSQLNGERQRAGAWAASSASGAGPRATLVVASGPVADGGDLTVNLTALAGAPVMPDDQVSLACGATVAADDFFDLLPLGAAAGGPLPLSVTFASLPFLRCAWTATYWSAVYAPGPLSWVAAGNVTAANVDALTAPKQVHLGLAAARGSSVTVSWTTGGPLAGAPAVQWGRAGGPLAATAPASTGTYAAADMCSPPASTVGQAVFRDPGLLHNATLDGLAPGAAYAYRVGSDADGWSDAFTFTAPPAAGAPAAFAAYGDQDTDAAAANSTRLVAAAAARGEAGFVLINGDLGYAMGSAWVWDRYMTMLQAAAASVPHVAQVGNHEYDSRAGGTFSPSWWNNGYQASEGECGVPVLARLPSPGASAAHPFYFAFGFGDVFIVALSSEHDWTEGSAQWAWLNATLAGVDRATFPWLVLSTHRPLYSTQLCEAGDYVVALHMRPALDPLLWRYRVNAFLVAHTHAWERTCAVSSVPGGGCAAPGPGCACAPPGTGTTHFTIGAAGAGLEGCGFSPAYGAFSQSRANAWGVALLDTVARPGFMRVRFVLDADGSTFDEALVAPWNETAAAEVEARW